LFLNLYLAVMILKEAGAYVLSRPG